jgi:hypothetical protein
MTHLWRWGLFCVHYGLPLVLEKVDSGLFLLGGRPLEELLVFSKDFLDASLFIAANIRQLLTDLTHVRVTVLLHLLAKLLETVGLCRKSNRGCK